MSFAPNAPGLMFPTPKRGSQKRGSGLVPKSGAQKHGAGPAPKPPKSKNGGRLDAVIEVLGAVRRSMAGRIAMC